MGMYSRGLLEVGRGMERFLRDLRRDEGLQSCQIISRRPVRYGIEPL
jgi:hypothetical protein